jgi:DNA-directed RNA polymerase subunit E"
MVTKKACKICKAIYEGDRCTECGSQEYTEDFKGRVMVFDPEKSEIAKQIKINKKGIYAIKSK